MKSESFIARLWNLPIGRRFVTKALIALLLTVGLADRAVFRQVSVVLGDILMLNPTPPITFERIAVVDIEEDSLAVMDGSGLSMAVRTRHLPTYH